MNVGKLDFIALEGRPDLVAKPVKKYIEVNGLSAVLVSEIDPKLADKAAFCEHYCVPMNASANCVILEAKRADKTWYAACIVLATSRADVNGIVRRQLDARRVSFAPMDKAVQLSDMEYGGITPIGLPGDWTILVDSAVANSESVVIGSGIRKSKLLVPGNLLPALNNVKVLDITKTG